MVLIIVFLEFLHIICGQNLGFDQFLIFLVSLLQVVVNRLGRCVEHACERSQRGHYHDDDDR